MHFFYSNLTKSEKTVAFFFFKVKSEIGDSFPFLFVYEQLQVVRFPLVSIFLPTEPSRNLQSGEEKDTRLCNPVVLLAEGEAEVRLYNPISSTHTNHY